MAAAITLFTVLTLSIMCIRVASVALRLTGMPNDAARFQARSAFTGAGFTTTESELIVAHPLRRRIVSILMVVGNLGLVSVMATVVVSLVDASGSSASLLNQLLWLGGVLFFLFCVALNPKLDRIMCDAIGRLLERSHLLNVPTAPNLPEGMRLTFRAVQSGAESYPDSVADIEAQGVRVLALRRPSGKYLLGPGIEEKLQEQDELVLYGTGDKVKTVDEQALRLREAS